MYNRFATLVLDVLVAIINLKEHLLIQVANLAENVYVWNK